jgi:hypothetical protein
LVTDSRAAKEVKPTFFSGPVFFHAKEAESKEEDV